MGHTPSAAQPTLRWWERAWLPGVLLVLGLARQLWVNLTWIRTDGRVGLPVYSSMGDNLAETIALHASGQLWAQRLSGFEPIDLLSLTGLVGWLSLGREPDALNLTVIACLLGAQLLLVDLGRRLGSLWAGVLAALLLGVMPELSAMARCWAPQIPQIFLLLAALDCLVASRGLSRPLPSVGVALLLVAGTAYSPMKTDNLLFGLTGVGMVGGAVLRGVAVGRGPGPGQAVTRWRVAAGAGAVAAVVLLGAWLLHFRYVGLDYYGAELNNEAYRRAGAWWVPANLSAYPRWLFWFGLEPLLAVASLVGAGLFCWRGRARAELLGSVLLPLLVLGVLYKKNPYYVAGIYPGLVLVTAVGLARVPRRWPGLLALVGALAVGWWGWERASSASQGPQPSPRFADAGTVFQSFAPPDLHPRSDSPADRELALIEAYVPPLARCSEATVLCVVPYTDDAALGLRVLGHNACLQRSTDPEIEAERCDWVLVRSEAGAAWRASAGLEEVARDHRNSPRLTLLRSPDASGP
jgi:hypothetical protein